MSKNLFIHLRVHSSYSLAEGAIKIYEEKPKDGGKPPRKDLIKLCLENEMPAVAVTDKGNLFGALEFAMTASGAGIQPIIGCQIAVARSDQAELPPSKRDIYDQLVLLVQNEAGYRNLSTLVTQSFVAPQRVVPHVLWAELEKYSDGLIALTAGIDGTVARGLLENQPAQAEAALLHLKTIFADRLYIEVCRHQGGEISRQEKQCEGKLVALALQHNIPLVATNDVYFGSIDMFEAHDALLCISDKTLVAEQNRRRLTPCHRFKTAAEMHALFEDMPEAVENTVVIAKRCAFMPKPRQPIMPAFPLDGGVTEVETLQTEAKAGLAQRLDAVGITERHAYEQRLAFEIDIITKMGFAGYFLIVSDFIRWSKNNHIPVGPGRGSGAGSVVAWALQITDLDPIRFGLLFERFLNPERVSMPDFDVDFCQEKRDEVIAYVQRKYGVDRVAQIITFGKLQARAVLRDVGRVLAMSYGYIDKICKIVPSNPANPVTLQQAIEQEPQLQQLRADDPNVAQLMDISLKLEGLYRNASTHAAGVVIGDRPLVDLVPLYRDPEAQLPATQFNMKMVETAGLVKFDFLGLKTLDVLQQAVDLLKERNIHIDLTALPFEDEKTYALLARGDTTGVFQLESAGMRDVLRRLRPNRFDDIIALVALYRPGPMDNIPTYVKCKNGEEAVEYLHPMLEPILKDTFGILIYQEQVMQAAQILAGYSLGAADLLRRAMGKKKPEEMAAQRANFVQGAGQNNIPSDQAGMIFDQIDKFAGYGFNKSHAAAYALIAYQTAYLKANYPVEFFAAAMNFELGDTDKLNVFRQELARNHIALLPPDINRSGAAFRVESGEDGTLAIRYALAAIKGVGDAAMRSLVAVRDKDGIFKDMFDLAERIDPRVINRKQMEGLIMAGSFDGLLRSRAEANAAIDVLLRYSHAAAEERSSGQANLLGGLTVSAKPVLPQAKAWDEATRLQNEFQSLGFYLSAHPLDSFRAMLDRLGVVAAKLVASKMRPGGPSRFKFAGIVQARQERTSKNGNRFAFLQASDTSGAFEVTVFSDLLASRRDILEPGNAVLIEADAQINMQSTVVAATGGDAAAHGGGQQNGTQQSGVQQNTAQQNGASPEVRLIARNIELLSDVAARNSKGIYIRVYDAADVVEIQKMLAAASSGRGSVTLSLDLDEEEVDLELAGNWMLTEGLKIGLRQIGHGLDVQEI